jgi:putative PIN family toxin of toxin-antitoxin system
VRVFLDTNVLVSAFAARGLCAEVMELVQLEHELVIGRNVFRELETAFREKVKLPVAQLAAIVEFVAGEAIQVVDNAKPAAVNADLADALVLGEALAGRAEVFVTGDAALQRIEAIGTLMIVSPRQFWEVLRDRGG